MLVLLSYHVSICKRVPSNVVQVQRKNIKHKKAYAKRLKSVWWIVNTRLSADSG